MFAMEVFVVSLPRCKERRDQIDAQLRAAGVNAIFYPAVDGSTLALSSIAAYDRRKAWVYYGSAMSPAEVACCLSHRGVLKEIIRRKLPYALVLEDDADVDADLLHVCRDLVAESFAAWELVRLQTLKGRVRHPKTPRDLGVPICAVGRRTLYRLKGHVLGAGAYLITYAGAVKMLDYGERIFLPFDHAMDRFWENGLLPYVVRPFPVRHRDGVASEIGVRGWAAFGESGGLLRIKQRGRRLSDSLCKRLFNLCLEASVAAQLLSLVGVRVARTALAASAQLRARKTPLTASAEPAGSMATIVYLDPDGRSVQKSRRKASETVRGRSGVTSGADRTLKGLP